MSSPVVLKLTTKGSHSSETSCEGVGIFFWCIKPFRIYIRLHDILSYLVLKIFYSTLLFSYFLFYFLRNSYLLSLDLK